MAQLNFKRSSLTHSINTVFVRQPLAFLGLLSRECVSLSPHFLAPVQLKGVRVSHYPLQNLLYRDALRRLKQGE